MIRKGIASRPPWIYLFFALCFTAATARPQTYPNPYPRENARSVLSNDRVNVWRVIWPKGQPTAMHEHPFDQLSVTLSGGTVRVTRLGREPVVNHSTLGSVAFTPKGTVHMEEGLSDVPQGKIMLELKPSPPTDAVSFPREGAVKLLANDRLIAWDFTWKPGQTVPRHQNQLDYLTVFLEGGTIKYVPEHGGATYVTNSAGDVVYTPHSQRPQIEQAVRGSPRAVIVELK
jgi:quercetin dioxygenase-like cupin family protein